MSGVALVLAGGGARGAYEIGVLAEILPALQARGERVRIVTGASSGAINAVGFAGLVHLPLDELFAVSRARWRDVVLPHVLGSVALRQLPQLVARYLGSVTGVPGVRLPALFDPVPLNRHLPRWLDMPQGRRNLEAGMLDHVAVLATNAHTGRPAAFVAGARQPRTRPGTVAYHHAELGVDALRASAAIPGLFPPVELTTGPAPGWYVDGTTRLRSPLLPALNLGAEKLVVVATDAATEGAADAAAGGPGRPGLADALAQLPVGDPVEPRHSFLISGAAESPSTRPGLRQGLGPQVQGDLGIEGAPGEEAQKRLGARVVQGRELLVVQTGGTHLALQSHHEAAL